MSVISDSFELKQKRLFGKMIFSTVANAEILSITLPDIKDVFLITSDNLKYNELKLYSNCITVLGSKFSSFEGQCIAAVFAPDQRTLETAISEVNVKYGEVQKDEKELVFSKTFRTKSDIVPSQNVKKTVFSVARHSNSLFGAKRVFAKYTKDGRLYIKGASQWPVNLIDNVSYCLGLERKNIVFEQDGYKALFDQLLFGPQIALVVASAAAMKTDMVVEFNMPMVSTHPDVKIEIETGMDADNRVLYQSSNIMVDMGAFPFCVQEYAESVIAGVVSPYRLDAAQTQVNIYKSANAPGNIFMDFGYSVAKAASETHYSSLIESLNMSPSQWRIDNIKQSCAFKMLFSCPMFSKLSRIVEDVSVLSWFNRQYAANRQNYPTRETINPIINYSRGMGIACGNGIQGFSEFRKEESYSAQAVFTEDKKLKIYSAFTSDSDSSYVYSKILEEKLGLLQSDISFENVVGLSSYDLGPRILSRSTQIVPVLMEKLSNEILNQINSNAKYPITVKVSTPKVYRRSLYKSVPCASIVIGLRVDPLKLVPEINNVWAKVIYGRIFDRENVTNILRQTILQTINEFCPNAVNTYDIDLNIVEKQNYPAFSACSLVRALTISAFASALSQALGHNINKYPVYEQDIPRLLYGKDKGTTKNED